MLCSFIVTVEDFWIWHILIQFGIKFSPFGIFRLSKSGNPVLYISIANRNISWLY